MESTRRCLPTRGVVQVLVSIFRNAWTPHSIEALKEKGFVRDEIFSKVLSGYLLAFFTGGVVFVLCSGFLVDLILPPAYQSGVVIVPWLVGAAVLHGASSIANVGTLVTKRTIGNTYASVIALFSSVLLSLLLIEKYGFEGSCNWNFYFRIAFFCFLLLLSHRQIRIRFNFSLIIVLLLSYVCFCFWVSFTVRECLERKTFGFGFFSRSDDRGKALFQQEEVKIPFLNILTLAGKTF